MANPFLDMRKYIACNELGNDYVEALNNRISLSIIGLGLNAISLPNYQAIQEIKRIISGNEYRVAIRELPMKYFHCIGGCFCMLQAELRTRGISAFEMHG